jgi:ABC-type polysaccharide/polyol phosphate export permease
MTSSIGLGLNLIILVLFILLSDIEISFLILLSLAPLIILMLIAAGLAFLLCAAYARFRDIQHIWNALLSVGFWLTPVAYPESMVPIKFHFLLNFNPIYLVLKGFRDIVLHQKQDIGLVLGISLIVSMAIFSIGYFIFRRSSKKFTQYL